jgi:hypothetical protein
MIGIESHAARDPSARPVARHGHSTALWPAGLCQHGLMHQAVPGPPLWPVARPGHGTVVQAGTVTARCPRRPSSGAAHEGRRI